MKYFASAFIGLALTGCAQQPPVNAIKLSAISKVLAEIKREVSVYQAKANEWRNNPSEDPAHASERAYVCGTGNIDFDITSVQAELTTTVDTTASGSLGFTIAVTGPTGSIGPKLNTSRQVSNTQKMDFTLYPIADPTFIIDPPDTKPAPIADALITLRTALIAGATAPGVCMYDYNHTDPKSDKGHSYDIGMTLTNDTGGGIDVKLAIVSFSASGEAKSVTGNTLTVAFQQRGITNAVSDTGKGAAGIKGGSQPGVLGPGLRHH